MAQQDQWLLGSAGMQVRSLAQHSGLRIQRCRSYGFGHDCSSNLILGLGTQYVVGQPEKEKKKNHTGKNKQSQGTDIKMRPLAIIQ